MTTTLPAPLGQPPEGNQPQRALPVTPPEVIEPETWKLLESTLKDGYAVAFFPYGQVRVWKSDEPLDKVNTGPTLEFVMAAMKKPSSREERAS